MKSTNGVRVVPKRVCKTLEKVRDSGFTNMFLISNVVECASYYDEWSSIWLNKYCLKPSGRPKQTGEYSNVLNQFSQYLKDKSNEITNS